MESGVSAFDFLFPGDAMTNSILATSYISIIPNLLLYFVPPNIKPSTLNLLVNFAVGSLLGDVFLHLIPHAFMEHEDSHIEDIIHASHDHHIHHHGHDHHDYMPVEHHHDDSHHDYKSLLIGMSIFLGMFIFYATDKIMREFFGKTGHDHSHDHLIHEHTEEDKKECAHQSPQKDIRASAYLNLLADFTHNLTDGIALSASFYASKSVGATTAVAVFFHEIPHEVSDYAILIQSGFSKKRAMMAQFTTAIGAYIGTFIGIFIEEVATQMTDKAHHHSHGIMGTHLNMADLVIPVTAGGFLYISTVGVIPELLETKGGNKMQVVKELSAMILGVALMALIALNEDHHH
ncbi:Zinc/iron permease [Pilobolus umbonatus]|nr:Zinc/iron permease [Pilobolus umbonatus]